jgi:hypothetical protein
MISSVTIATVDGTARTAEIAGVFWLLLLLMLVGLLIGKEILMGTASPGVARWNRALLVGIVPLTYVFGFILIVTIGAFVR